MDNPVLRAAVIDDEKISGRRLWEHLQELGYSADIFYDGESFLQNFLASPHDLVVTDLKLPGMDGLGILRRVKERASGDRGGGHNRLRLGGFGHRGHPGWGFSLSDQTDPVGRI